LPKNLPNNLPKTLKTQLSIFQLLTLRPEGLERPPQNTGKTFVSKTRGAKSGALSPNIIPFDPDQQRILEAWPTLPEALRAGIMAMIDSARPKDTC